jgi:hypothetical protein
MELIAQRLIKEGRMPQIERLISSLDKAKEKVLEEMASKPRPEEEI